MVAACECSKARLVQVLLARPDGWRCSPAIAKRWTGETMRKHLMSARVVLVGAIAALFLAGPRHTAQVAAQAGRGFSFVALGDSRPMMYLPYKEGQPELNKL